MKIGMITESLASLSFDEVLKTSSKLGIEMLSFLLVTGVQPPILI